MEHISQRDMVATHKGIRRLLIPNGELMISVPDLDTLCKLFTHMDLTLEHRFYVIRMMFGGQTDDFDFHYIGLSFDILSIYLAKAGFATVWRVKDFGLFND